MDSLTQLALGSVTAHAVAGKSAGRKALLWGAVIGTLPDLDVLMRYFYNDIDMLMIHRGYSHAWFVHLCIAPLIALLPWSIHRSKGKNKDSTPYWRWLLLALVALTTHSLIDLFTVYGTQVFLPFSDTPYSMDIMFIVDPLFTLPLLIALVLTLIKPKWVHLSHSMLAVCAIYSMSSFVAHQTIQKITLESLNNQNLPTKKLLISPAPFTTFLWRIIVLDGPYWYEGEYSIFKNPNHIQFKRHNRNLFLVNHLKDRNTISRLRWFNRGFFEFSEKMDQILLSDLRFGESNNLVFNWALAEQNNQGVWQEPQPIKRQREDVDMSGYFNTLMERIF